MESSVRKIVNDAHTLSQRAHERFSRAVDLHRESMRDKALMWILIVFVGSALLIISYAVFAHGA